MTLPFPKLMLPLLRFHEWELNPVLLKELRQAVRGNFLVSTLLTMLGVLFVVSVSFLVQQEESGAGRQTGLPVVRVFVAVLTVVSVLLVPLYIGLRLAWERRKADLDLMFVTLLAPGQIVRGKLLCGLYLLVLFFSVFIPFATITNLMRGVDLFSIVFILVCVFGVACLAIQTAICYGFLRVHFILKMFLGLILILGCAAMSAGSALFSFHVLASGVGTGVSFWFGFGMAILLLLGGIGVLQVISVSLMVPGTRPPGYFSHLSGKRNADERAQTVTRSEAPAFH